MHLTYILHSHHSVLFIVGILTCPDPNLHANWPLLESKQAHWQLSLKFHESSKRPLVLSTAPFPTSLQEYFMSFLFSDFQHVLPHAFLSPSLGKKNSQKGTSHVLAPQQTRPLCISVHCILSLHHRQAVHPCLSVLPVCYTHPSHTPE